MSALRKLAVAAAILASVHSAEALTYTVDTVDAPSLDDIVVIFASGSIEQGEANRFWRFLDALPLTSIAK